MKAVEVSVISISQQQRGRNEFNQRVQMRHTFVRRYCRVLLAACALIVPWSAAHAQTTTGSIRGRVVSSEGSAVPEVTVLAKSLTIGNERGVQTNSDGYYSVGGLRPDRYSITVRRIGYAPATDIVTVQIGQTLTRDYRIAAATAQLSTVLVTAEAAGAVETRTSEIATN